MSGQIKCKVCGNIKDYCARGLCRKCYNAEYKANNRDRIAEQQAEYYQQNRDRIAEQQAEYYQQNRDRIAEYYQQNRDRLAEYYQQNRDKIAEYKAEYRQQNRDKIAEYQAEYYQQNRDKIAEYYQQNRDRKCWHNFNKNSKQRGYDGAITFDEYLTLKSQTTCFYCGCELGKHPADGLDHVIHHTHGGKTEIDNLVPACYKCNNTKKDKLAIQIDADTGAPLETIPAGYSEDHVFYYYIKY